MPYAVAALYRIRFDNVRDCRPFFFDKQNGSDVSRARNGARLARECMVIQDASINRRGNFDMLDNRPIFVLIAMCFRGNRFRIEIQLIPFETLRIIFVTANPNVLFNRAGI